LGVYPVRRVAIADGKEEAIEKNRKSLRLTPFLLTPRLQEEFERGKEGTWIPLIFTRETKCFDETLGGHHDFWGGMGLKSGRLGKHWDRLRLCGSVLRELEEDLNKENLTGSETGATWALLRR